MFSIATSQRMIRGNTAASFSAHAVARADSAGLGDISRYLISRFTRRGDASRAPPGSSFASGGCALAGDDAVTRRFRRAGCRALDRGQGLGGGFVDPLRDLAGE